MTVLLTRSSVFKESWLGHLSCQLSPPQRPLTFSRRGVGRGETKARRGWGEGNSKYAGNSGKEAIKESSAPLSSLFPSCPTLPNFSFSSLVRPIFLPFPYRNSLCGRARVISGRPSQRKQTTCFLCFFATFH